MKFIGNLEKQGMKKLMKSIGCSLVRLVSSYSLFHYFRSFDLIDCKENNWQDWLKKFIALNGWLERFRKRH